MCIWSLIGSVGNFKLSYSPIFTVGHWESSWSSVLDFDCVFSSIERYKTIDSISMIDSISCNGSETLVFSVVYKNPGDDVTGPCASDGDDVTNVNQAFFGQIKSELQFGEVCPSVCIQQRDSGLVFREEFNPGEVVGWGLLD